MKNTKYLKIPIRFLLVLCSALGIAQELPTVVPGTPEVAAISKYGDIPVNLFTGVPSISIPLVSLDLQQIGTSVALRYHASGIRVNEVSSRVGIGWSLSGVGMVSRGVRGTPDDYVPGGFLYNPMSGSEFLAIQPREARLDPALAALRGLSDYESDIYSYNLPSGESGKFFFNNEKQIVQIPSNSDTRIIAVYANQIIVGWKITTPSGVVYHLGRSQDGTRQATDNSETLSWNTSGQLPDGPASLSNYISSWHLMDVVSPTDQVLHYSYASSTIDYVSIGGQRQILHLETSDTNCSAPGGISTSYIQTISNTHRLTSIASDQMGTIELDYSWNRTDLKNDKALTRVTLKDVHGNAITSYALDYGYFESPQGNSVNYGDIEQRTKRLYLKSVSEVAGPKENKRYAFEYHTDHILPDRLSFSQDFWGYYNGKTNSSFLPAVEYFYNQSFISKPGADRKVYTDFAKACTLKKIHYPTGGTQEFVMESNTTSRGPEFFAATNYDTEVMLSFLSANDFREEIELPFTINDSQDDFAFPVRGIVDYNLQIDGGICTTNGLDCPQVYIKKVGSSGLGLRLTKAQGAIFLENGSYIVNIINYSDSFGARRNVQITLSGRKLIAGQPIALSGGLRVKEIKTQTPSGGPIFTKSYNYRDFESPNLSSGHANNPPVYLESGLPYCTNTQSASVQLLSNPIFSLDNQAGYSVGYTNVTESYKGEKTGKTEYTYYFIGESEDQGVFPKIPLHDLSHRRGLLLKQEDLELISESNKTFRTVREIRNTYDFGTNQDKIESDNIVFGSTGNKIVQWSTYTNYSEPLFRTGTQTKDYYYIGGTKIVSNQQKLYYDSFPTHSQVTRTEVTNSDGKVSETKTYYPDDISSATVLGTPFSTTSFNAIKRLQNSGIERRVAQPIQTETITNGEKSIQRTDFKTWNGTTLPEFVSVAKKDHPLEERIQYHRYDAKGNPLEVSQVDGIPMIYVWGYDNSYPIAKIERASYGSLTTAQQNAINNAKSAADDDTSAAKENTLRDRLKDLRNQFPDAMVATYTYDPIVGVTSMTDPKGYTLYYQYDDFNRLQFVKDADQNIISENNYNYTNQNTAQN